jgi:DNA-binding transcriptional ArsR family regulator
MPSASEIAVIQDDESQTLDQVFSALADPVRRNILRRLDGENLLVSELAKPIPISLQAVSRHIQVLVKAGLVTQHRTGRISQCQLDAGPIFQAAMWVNRYSKYWQTQFDTLAAWLDHIESERTAATTIRSSGKHRGKSKPKQERD